MTGRRWRWVHHHGTHHLARETCQGEWVAVCDALSAFPFNATPERITLQGGGVAWALKSKVKTFSAWSGSFVRVALRLGRDPVCSECRAHAREIAGLWRGLRRGPARKGLVEDGGAK